LFAIGLSPVFSLRTDLRPILGCIPKQPDSWKAPRGAADPRADGVLTLSDAAFQQTWAPVATEGASIDYNSPKGDFQVGLIPFRSPLLGESLLVSFPPLIDMLKFSGCSCLSSGREKRVKTPGEGRAHGPKPTTSMNSGLFLPSCGP
jgi:hypothetical protein